MNQCTTQIPNFSPACDRCEQTQGENKEVRNRLPAPGCRSGLEASVVVGRTGALWLATVKAKETKSR